MLINLKACVQAFFYCYVWAFLIFVCFVSLLIVYLELYYFPI